jgi:hypothetical protein
MEPHPIKTASQPLEPTRIPSNVLHPQTNVYSTERQLSSSMVHHPGAPPVAPYYVPHYAYPAYNPDYYYYYHHHHIAAGQLSPYPLFFSYPPTHAPPGSHYSSWFPQAPASLSSSPIPSEPVEYVVNVKPEDVLSGRGGATNSHSGNRAFRNLVKEYQERYLRAKKRDKPDVASVVVDVVRKRGGRFLRRTGHTDSLGQVLWADIGDDRAREKACQALREGAPEIRRQRKRRRLLSSRRSEQTSSSFSLSDDDIDDNGGAASTFYRNDHIMHNFNDHSNGNPPSRKEMSPTDSTRSPSMAQFTSHKSQKVRDKSDLILTSDESTEHGGWYGVSRSHSDGGGGSKHRPLIPHSVDDDPCLIRPCSRLISRWSQEDTEPISLHSLPISIRDTYLNDFQPPLSTTVGSVLLPQQRNAVMTPPLASYDDDIRNQF